ncbi:hypothetical protein M2480_000780 [Parabacteroides sp. PFB2-12]|nr:hypothetical protein [Parabacteroides sp. PM6-13]MDH6389814.1 hypothetical protein [Parabacteroides sp. PFB2-12]
MGENPYVCKKVYYENKQRDKLNIINIKWYENKL